jgi:hypothetical protein
MGTLNLLSEFIYGQPLFCLTTPAKYMDKSLKISGHLVNKA